jgi:uncharacterized RDD family membrane protein YckC
MHQENPQASASESGQIASCVECGNAFPARDMIQFGAWSVCADCKPVFQQKLAEGSFRPRNLHYASVGRRFAAVAVDGMIIWFGFLLIGLIGYLITGKNGMAQGLQNLGAISWQVLSQLLGVAYTVFFIGRFGATPGKMILGVKVVRATGSPVGYALATGRYFSTFVSGLTLGIGYFMAFFDDERKSLHDRICGTRVIRN